ncbi:glycerol-3-phosphate 1-O-acyltransferase [Leptotrichia sp. OH3620_COT-345]|uniref:glycerol-3-phosphate 1-O-acyltransferase PlsY n=1 Tax=Leptotrichia sp. OH3620_COT-345 TaxID=2491048 RepID=UPI000F651F98|nr:glycerol-3-phosphate 1-O-acyltransferase PlsY [Leptotrichia sp. OH3620_COT-345]RRD40193.1 glycerol-3-phosphate 1-O-acyltransferase [Leptotrichia sp. OH3620_COT-345]
MNTFLLGITAYFLGSIPNALWIGKVFKGIDVREHGSRNTGSTNAARVLGAKLGILTLILDICKGALPTGVALLAHADTLENLTGISNTDAIAVGIAAIIGHSFSIFMKFKGGKAVATTVGVFTVLAPVALLLTAVVFFTVFGISRYVSLSSIIGASSLPIFIYAFYRNIPITVFGLGIAILIVMKHRSNIERIRNGTESKFTINKK